jgi:hypothetical protein
MESLTVSIRLITSVIVFIAAIALSITVDFIPNQIEVTRVSLGLISAVSGTLISMNIPSSR